LKSNFKFSLLFLVLFLKGFSQTELVSDNLKTKYTHKNFQYSLNFPSKWKYNEAYNTYYLYYITKWTLPYNRTLHENETIEIVVYQNHFDNEDDLYYEFNKNEKRPGFLNISRCNDGFLEISSNSYFDFKRYYLVKKTVGYVITFKTDAGFLEKRETEFDQFFDSISFFN
jgi:hypothetical protein